MIVIITHYCLPSPTQDEYVSQLQNQIRDLERYITFLQASSPNPRPLTDDTSSSELDTSSSHDSPYTKSHDLHGHTPSSKKRRSKKVTFAESQPSPSVSLPPPSPASRSRLIGPTLGNRHQPVPDYRLSLTQLDGVDCSVESKMWEWERVDPLGSSLPPDYVDAGLSETDKVC